jgi:N-acetylmuramoyl-L-alanine amidase
MIYRIITLLILLSLTITPNTSLAEDFLAEYYEHTPAKVLTKPTSQKIKPASVKLKQENSNKPKSFSAERKHMQTRQVVAKPASSGIKNLTYQKQKTEKLANKPQSLGQHNVFEIKKLVATQQKNVTSTISNEAIKNSSNLTIKGPFGNAIPQKPYFSVSLVTDRKPLIVIDPGHGGKDPGATGKFGTREKNITLSYGIALMKALQKTGKFKVVMTRYDDRFIELRDRVSMARKSGGDVLISIHADSHPDKNTRGFSVYTLSNNRASAEAEALVKKADREEVIRGANLRGESLDVKEAIIDFAQESSKNVSDDFAATIGKHLGRRIQPLNKHQREGSLAVLTGADIPSVLIELGYLSNINEEKLLRTEEHKQKIITSLTNAITEYFTKFNMVF